MTTLKNKPLLAIIAIGIATALAAVVFSVQSAAHAQEAFGGSGYVLQVENTQTDDDAAAQESGDDSAQAVEPLVAPVAFAEDATYRHRFPDTVQFNDADGNKATVSQKSFVHYDDKSIAAFVKTVFVDLDHVNDPVVYYYDLPAGRTMEFEGGSWRLDNGGSELSFTHVLMKLDEAHYLVLSDDITFSVNGETQQNFKGAGSYLEVEYIEGGIVRFSNDQGSYQTIASDATVAVGNGVSVNFGDKLVSTEDGAKLSLDQMVIDADDNIQISPEAAEALAGGADGEDGAEGAGAESGAAGAGAEGAGDSTTTIVGGGASASGGAGGSSSSGSMAGGVLPGGDGQANGQTNGQTNGQDGGSQNNQDDQGGGSQAGDDTEGDGEEGGDVLEDTNDSRKTPSFSISEGSTSPVGFEANISITDEENMLSSGTTVTIVDRLTGKVVYESNVAAGVLDFDISAAGLDPDKEYVLSATATYRDGDQEYTKSFLDKVFKTDPVGIMMNKSYAAVDALGINVQVGAYANVVNAKLRLLDAQGNQVEMKDIDVNGARVEGGVDVVFENLNSNSVYAAELREVTYSNVTVESFGDALALKTLRQAPSLPVPVSTPDRKANSFTLELPKDQIEDPDAGITGYRWEVYDSTDVDVDAMGENVFDADPVWTAEPAQGTKVTLPVDGLKILNGHRYVARVLVNFDDNEKVITYDTPFTTPPFGIDGVAFPTVRLEAVNDPDKYPDGPITFESYHGVLYIDNAAAIVHGSEIKVVYRDDIGNESEVITHNVTDNGTGTITIPLDLYNLRQSTTYTVQVYATYNLGDGITESVNGYIGSARFNTLKADTASVAWGGGQNPSTGFSATLKLGNTEGSGNIELEMKTMSLLTVTLHQGGTADGPVLGRPHTLVGGTVNEQGKRYNSELYKKVYEAPVTLKPEDFGLDKSDIKPDTEYTLVAGPAVDYTKNKNQANKDMPNEVPLENAVFSFTTLKTWPSLPADPSQGVAVEIITNNLAEQFPDKYPAGGYDSSLDPETVLGFAARADFDNGNKIAREVTYNLYDAERGITSEPLATHTEEVKADGVIPTWTVMFGKGDFRSVTRGHRYIFTYTMKIELKEGDQVGEGILTYPACAKPDDPSYQLTSGVLDAPMQLAKLSMYVESRDAGKDGERAVWKWVASDPDDTLGGARTGNEKAYFSQALGNALPDSIPLVFNGNGDWNTIEADIEAGKSYTLRLHQNPYRYNKKNDIVQTDLATHYVEPMRSWSTSGDDAEFTSVTWKMGEKPGDLDVTVTASEAVTREELAAVAALELTFTANAQAKKPVTLVVAPEITSEGGPCRLRATIALADIESLLGNELTVSAKVLYDTGAFGVHDADGSLSKGDLVAFQELSAAVNTAGNYMKIPAGATYSYQTAAELSGAGNMLAADMPALNSATAFDDNGGNAADVALNLLGSKAGSKARIASSEGGLLLLDAAGVPSGKAVAVKHLATSGGKKLEAEEPFKFDSIPALVSGVVITPGIDRAHVSFTPELVGMVAEGGVLRIELHELTEDGNTVEHEFEYPKVFTNGGTRSITIPAGIDEEGSEQLGLNPKSSYSFELYIDARIASDPNDKPEKTQLVNKETAQPETYTFKLNDNVPVSLTDVEVVPDVNEPYAKKGLLVRYNLQGTVLGFETRVEVFAVDEDGNATGDPLLSGTKSVNAEKDEYSFAFGAYDREDNGKITLGERYLFRVSCYTLRSWEGEEQLLLGQDERIVMLDTLDKPTTSITARPKFETVEIKDEEQQKINDAARAERKARAEQLAADAAAALEREAAERAAAEQAAAKAQQEAAADAQTADAAATGETLDNGVAQPGTESTGAAGSAQGETAFAGSAAVATISTAAAEVEPLAEDDKPVVTIQNKYGLEFSVTVFDLEGSLVDGKYKVRFFKGRDPLPTEYDDDVFEIKDRNKSFVLNDLKPDSSYSIEVYGVLDAGNTGELESIEGIQIPTEEHLIATGSGKTTPSSGVEVGIVQLSQRPEYPNQFSMSYYGSLNLHSVERVKYTIYSTSQVVKNETVDFQLTQAGSAESPYYIFNPGVDLTEVGLYTIQMTYLGADGKTLATGTYEYVLPTVAKGR